MVPKKPQYCAISTQSLSVLREDLSWVMAVGTAFSETACISL